MRRGGNAMSIKRKIMHQAGFTLLELILSIALLSIIMIAAFSGLHFAYNTLFASKELSKQAYTIQKEYEGELAKVRQLPTDTTGATYLALDASRVIDDQPIVFDWSSGTLVNFNAQGLTIIKEGKGGDYLEESIYMFIPLYTEESP